MSNPTLLLTTLLSLSFSTASILPRQAAPQIPISANAGPAYNPPATAQPIKNTGEGWHPGDNGHPEGPSIQDPAYQARPVDLPFLRNFGGVANFYDRTNYPKGGAYPPQALPGGDPVTVTQTSRYAWGAQYDDARQSACGIPSNAYWLSGIAIHPYFLKYANLDRMCLPDLCVSVWRDQAYSASNGNNDMMFKVTDICDPDVCKTPMDIKMDRDKYNYLMAGPDNPYEPAGTQGDKPIYWMFTKCWGDGLAQSAYNGNWFNTPSYNNYLNFSQTVSDEQYYNNQANYPAVGLPTHSIGQQDHWGVDPLTDWTPGAATPAWQPIAGGGHTN